MDEKSKSIRLAGHPFLGGKWALLPWSSLWVFRWEAGVHKTRKKFGWEMVAGEYSGASVPKLITRRQLPSHPADWTLTK